MNRNDALDQISIMASWAKDPSPSPLYAKHLFTHEQYAYGNDTARLHIHVESICPGVDLTQLNIEANLRAITHHCTISHGKEPQITSGWRIRDCGFHYIRIFKGPALDQYGRAIDYSFMKDIEESAAAHHGLQVHFEEYNKLRHAPTKNITELIQWFGSEDKKNRVKQW